MKKRTKKSNRSIVIILMAVGLYIVFSDDDDAAQRQRPPVADRAESAPEREPRTPADGPLVWPPATEAEVQLAANPLADNYLLMLDISGSMSDLACNGSERKLEVAKRAVKAFHRQLDPNAKVGLFTFSETIREVLPIRQHEYSTFSSNVDLLKAGGGTPLRLALSRSEEVLRKAAQTQGGYGSYNLILVTDGQSSDGPPGDEAQQIARTTAITINAIGFCTGSNHSLNIAGYTNFSTADDADQLVESLSKTVRAEQDIFDLSDFDPS